MSGFLLTISEWFNLEWHKQIYVNIVNMSYILLLLSLTRVMAVSPIWLSTIKMITLYYICFVLIFRFNPFVNKENKFDKYDRKIAFSAGMTLFLTTSLFQIFQRVFTTTITQTKDGIVNITHIISK